MADCYETLAADYDWLFDDDALAGGLAIRHPATARLLERTGRAGTVLDAACGTGISAAALARRGYRVRAADGSPAMVVAAAARFRREQLEIPLFAYPEGPPVLVDIAAGCHPEIDNLDLQSDSASTVLPLLRQLLKPG